MAIEEEKALDISKSYGLRKVLKDYFSLGQEE